MLGYPAPTQAPSWRYGPPVSLEAGGQHRPRGNTVQQAAGRGVPLVFGWLIAMRE